MLLYRLLSNHWSEHYLTNSFVQKLAWVLLPGCPLFANLLLAMIDSQDKMHTNRASERDTFRACMHAVDCRGVSVGQVRGYVNNAASPD